MEVKIKIKNTMEAIFARISKMKLLPIERNFEFFVKRSLCGEGTTRYVICIEKLVNKDDCEHLFGKPLIRQKYCFLDCRDLKVCSRILKVWSLIDLKTLFHRKYW